MQEGEYPAVGDACRIGAVAIHDAIRAAQREGEFEKLARERAEADLDSANEALSDANRKTKQLQAQLQEAHKSVTKTSELETQLRSARADLSKLQDELSSSQKKLRDCKQEAVSKAERLKAAKVFVTHHCEMCLYGCAGAIGESCAASHTRSTLETECVVATPGQRSTFDVGAGRAGS